MKRNGYLVWNNFKHKPVRTATLVTLICILAFMICAGSLTVCGMKQGMESLEKRLGADVIVVPKQVKTKEDLSKILLNGTTGYFYMDHSVLDQVVQTEGVEMASPQLFLASLRADCCSSAIQVIGIDQETDFSIQPWISQRYQGKLGEYEVVVGCEVNAQVGETIRIYNENCKVAARLAKTGTGLDTAVYTSIDTIRLLLTAAEELGHDLKISGDPQDVISAVYVKVKDGYEIEQVANNLKVYVRKTESIQTKSMLTGVADGLKGMEKIISVLLCVIWIIGFAVLMVVFCLMINERKREFAVLRLLGMSKKRLADQIRGEALLYCLAGGISGMLLGMIVIYSFSALFEKVLGMPFLLPGIGSGMVIGLFTMIVIMISGMIASAYTAHRLSQVDPGSALREGN